MNAIEHRLTKWLYRMFIDSPQAHAVLLRMYLGGEEFHQRFPWFDQTELVADTELRLLMQQHFADEQNHGKYFRLALTFKNEPITAPPLEMDALVQLAAGFWDAGILVGDVIEDLTGPTLFTNKQNLFVQLAFKDLSEKRAIHEFHIWRDLARYKDPETYAILKRVVEDEDWHVQIFDHQVHKMMADPVDGPALRKVYTKLVKVAKRINRNSSTKFLSHVLDRDMLIAKPWEKRALRLLIGLLKIGTGVLPMESARRLIGLQAAVYDLPVVATAHA